VKIICPIHGIFEQKPCNHSAGNGCHKCSNTYSQYEEKIEKWLIKNNIKYIREYKFNNCKNKYKLPFDFFLEEKNICIEFDGIYHYKPLHGEKELKDCIKRDSIKTKFCLDNGIILVRIPYWKKENIESILNKLCLSQRNYLKMP
jgi:very-short-patch-repair endonuclease